jgi:hypothetical protein
MAEIPNETPGENVRVLLERRAHEIATKCPDPIRRLTWEAISRERHEGISWEEAAIPLAAGSFTGIPREDAIKLDIALEVARNAGASIVSRLAEADQETSEDVPQLEASVRSIINPE